MGTKKIYDIHYHAFDLRHANITAFVNRLINMPRNRSVFERILNIPRRASKIFEYVKLPTRVANTLAMFEYPIEDQKGCLY